MSDDESSSSSSSNNDFLVAKSKNPKTSPPSSDSEESTSLRINTSYARQYDSRKRREELTNLRQAKALDDALGSDDSSSDSESEDEDAELLTADLDVRIVKTLRALKSKDEGIYDKNVNFFDNNDDSEEERKKGDKVKAMRYKDVVREHILEEMEAGEDALKENQNKPSRREGSDLAYDMEQQEIRRAFLESTKDDASEEEEEDNWLKPKSKKSTDTTVDLEVKRLWEEEFTSTKSKLIDPKGEVADTDKFLMDFMTHRKWVDTTDVALRKIDEEESIESFQDKMDDFESKYNFRFEEAAAANSNVNSGAHSIVHYARKSVDQDLLRRKDESRRQKRQSRKERKAEERRAKEEQLRRLKNAKREELEERMEQVRNVLGYDTNEGKHALGDAEEKMILKLMEGEYDPEKFEQVMNAAYGDEYYGQEDDKWKNDQDVKIDLAKGNEDDDFLGDGDLYDDANEDEEYHDNEDEIYDEDEAQWEDEHHEQSSGIDKKLKSKMMDELYKLDYEDIIGDMPTRFKYRSVEANSYGLSTEEILLAKDTSLKQFVSLKKMAPYRDEGEYQPGTKKRKRFRQMLKSDREEMAQSEQLEESKTAQDGNEEEGETKKKKRRRQKKGKKNSGEVDEKDVNDVRKNEAINVDAVETDKKHKQKTKPALEPSENTDTKTNNGPTNNNTNQLKEKKKEKNRHIHKGDKDKKKRRKKSGVEGVSAARLASYGI